MRRSASSITALTLPVRLRRVASGLMIEKVRSVSGLRWGSYGYGEWREGHGPSRVGVVYIVIARANATRSDDAPHNVC